MKLIEKILNARVYIKSTSLKKIGKNTYSNYEYFLPSQINQLVHDVSVKHRFFCSFDLKRDALGIVGKLTIEDLDSDSVMSKEMASAIPEIKATNIAQQLGGAVTYTERYLKMSFFDIVDNSLDFDTSENTKKTTQNIDNSQNFLSLSKKLELINDLDSLTAIYNENKDLVMKNKPLLDLFTATRKRIESGK